MAHHTLQTQTTLSASFRIVSATDYTWLPLLKSSLLEVFILEPWNIIQSEIHATEKNARKLPVVLQSAVCLILLVHINNKTKPGFLSTFKAYSFLN